MYSLHWSWNHKYIHTNCLLHVGRNVLVQIAEIQKTFFTQLFPSLSLVVIHKANYSSFLEKSCASQLWSQTTLPFFPPGTQRPKLSLIAQVLQSPSRFLGNLVCSKRSFPHGAMLSVLNFSLAIPALHVCWLVLCAWERESIKAVNLCP